MGADSQTQLANLGAELRSIGLGEDAIQQALVVEANRRFGNGIGLNDVRNAALGIGATEEFLSAKTPQPPSAVAERKLELITAADLMEGLAEDHAMEWIAQPWVCVGAITEVTGLPKTAGKTTWIMELVRSILHGSAFLGESVKKSRVVYLTEERPASLSEALLRARLDESRDLHILSWARMRQPWAATVDAVRAECKRLDATVLVVDTLGQFAGLRGDDENDAGKALRAMEPLQRAAGDGLAIIAVRHDRKAEGQVGVSGRGSNAFTGAVDTTISIRKPPASRTQRELHCLSRFDAVPSFLLVDKTKEGYVLIGNHRASVADQKTAAVSRYLQTSAVPRTLEEICQATEASRGTAQNVLKSLVADDKLERIGKGVRGDPLMWQSAPSDEQD